MKNFRILHRQNEVLLYEGRFSTFRQCLEQAVADKINLKNADLRNRNLMNGNFDGAKLIQADFSNANLTGANLSEARLNGAKLRNAALYNTCLAFSDLSQVDFSGALFGGTDITACLINGAYFTTLSCFSLNFKTVQQMKNCHFISPDQTSSLMSSPPIVIQGFAPQPLVVMDEAIHIGHERLYKINKT